MAGTPVPVPPAPGSNDPNEIAKAIAKALGLTTDAVQAAMRDLEAATKMAADAMEKDAKNAERFINMAAALRKKEYQDKEKDLKETIDATEKLSKEYGESLSSATKEALTKLKISSQIELAQWQVGASSRIPGIGKMLGESTAGPAGLFSDVLEGLGAATKTFQGEILGVDVSALGGAAGIAAERLAGIAGPAGAVITAFSLLKDSIELATKNTGQFNKTLGFATGYGGAGFGAVAQQGMLQAQFLSLNKTTELYAFSSEELEKAYINASDSYIHSTMAVRDATKEGLPWAEARMKILADDTRGAVKFAAAGKLVGMSFDESTKLAGQYGAKLHLTGNAALKMVNMMAIEAAETGVQAGKLQASFTGFADSIATIPLNTTDASARFFLLNRALFDMGNKASNASKQVFQSGENLDKFRDTLIRMGESVTAAQSVGYGGFIGAPLAGGTPLAQLGTAYTTDPVQRAAQQLVAFQQIASQQRGRENQVGAMRALVGTAGVPMGQVAAVAETAFTESNLLRQIAKTGRGAAGMADLERLGLTTPGLGKSVAEAGMDLQRQQLNYTNLIKNSVADIYRLLLLGPAGATAGYRGATGQYETKDPIRAAAEVQMRSRTAGPKIGR